MANTNFPQPPRPNSGSTQGNPGSVPPGPNSNAQTHAGNANPRNMQGRPSQPIPRQAIPQQRPPQPQNNQNSQTSDHRKQLSDLMSKGQHKPNLAPVTNQTRPQPGRPNQNSKDFQKQVRQKLPNQPPRSQPPDRRPPARRMPRPNQFRRPGVSPQPGRRPPARQSQADINKLKKMNTAQLRQQVISNQINIEKALINRQKEYAKGVNTIRDLIAPSAVKIDSDKLEIGTKKIRTFFVLTYPRVITSGWLEGLVNVDIPLDLSIFVYPRNSGEVLKDLKKKVGKIQASLNLNMEEGRARDPALETAYQDVEQLRDAIQQGIEKFYRVGVYVTIYADDLDELDRYSKTVENMLSQQNIIMKRAALQMDDGLNSTLPILKDDLDVTNNLNTAPLSAAFPFVSSDLSSDSGILYGVNRHNTSLIIFDRFELENANSVVFATSGAGKSYAVKLEILRSLMMGVSVIVIDPEQEYKSLADTVGGTYISMSLNSDNRINPFDLPRPLKGESRADILRTAIIDLIGLMRLMVGDVTPEEVSILERAVKECYEKRDINENTDFENAVMPTMSDLVDILNGIIGGETLAQKLYRYTEGTFAGIFNQRTNININNQFIVFNIRDLQDELRPIAMYILLKYVWNEVRSELKKRMLVVDEAWIMMQYDDSAKFLYGLVKRARKYYLGVTTITQDVGDFLNSQYGKPIVTNAAMKILLKQSTAAIDRIAEIFALTGGEKQVLLQSEVGQGIFFAGPRHVAIEIIAFPTEHKIITTSPKDLV